MGPHSLYLYIVVRGNSVCVCLGRREYGGREGWGGEVIAKRVSWCGVSR